MNIRLVNEPLDIYLEEIDKKFNILVIESKTLLSQIIQDIYQQLNNEYGDFVFSINDKPIKFKDNFDLIINPFELDINNRKILNIIQKNAIIEANNEVHYFETNEIITLLENYAQKIAYSFNGNITPKEELTSESIIKMINYQIDIFSTDFFGTINEYLINANKYLEIKAFCFINLFSFLEENQITELIKSSLDYDIHLIFIESQDTNYENDNCKKTIIDSDFCQI